MLLLLLLLLRLDSIDLRHLFLSLVNNKK